MVGDTTIATVALALVTASFPFYLYGAWIMIDADVVTWGVLTYHLKFIVTGLVLNTVPVVTWMAPRLFEQLGGLAALHAFLGLQAYALLVFALTGIYRILRAKMRYNLYNDPDQDVDLDELGEDMSHWRRRLRIGVFGYVVFWLLAYVLGVGRYLIRYGFLEAPF
ncbi:DUF7321 family protein [Haloarchaeobius amylolyticus]|uniref:DUF7321 family protein n=1 Tax=Haloarchaeobius amylolyticus TaxID=1198296 RepID=UPI0022705AEE|nr:hypothetical protein [Haloarchaeobius amylolyticus]